MRGRPPGPPPSLTPGASESVPPGTYTSALPPRPLRVSAAPKSPTPASAPAAPGVGVGVGANAQPLAAAHLLASRKLASSDSLACEHPKKQFLRSFFVVFNKIKGRFTREDGPNHCHAMLISVPLTGTGVLSLKPKQQKAKVKSTRRHDTRASLLAALAVGLTGTARPHGMPRSRLPGPKAHHQKPTRSSQDSQVFGNASCQTLSAASCLGTGCLRVS